MEPRETVGIDNNNIFLTTREAERVGTPLTSEDEGSFMFEFLLTKQNNNLVMETGLPSICGCKRGKFIWISIDNLSKKHWNEYRESFVGCLSRFSKEIITHFLTNDCSRGDGNNRLMLREKNQTNSELLLHLFHNLDNEDKKNVLKMFKDSIFANHTCIQCFKLAHLKQKCIHPSCNGMCTNCFQEWMSKEEKEICPACLKKQNIACPICKEDKTIDEVYQLKCDHSICWKCFGQSVVHHSQIKKCPLCRIKI